MADEFHPDTLPADASPVMTLETPQEAPPAPSSLPLPLPVRMENAAVDAMEGIAHGVERIIHPGAAHAPDEASAALSAAAAAMSEEVPAASHVEAVLAERGDRPASVAEALVAARASVSSAGETLRLAAAIERERKLGRQTAQGV